MKISRQITIKLVLLRYLLYSFNVEWVENGVGKTTYEKDGKLKSD